MSAGGAPTLLFTSLNTYGRQTVSNELSIATPMGAAALTMFELCWLFSSGQLSSINGSRLESSVAGRSRPASTGDLCRCRRGVRDRHGL